MASGRSLLVLACGLALWLAARLVGSPALHVVAAGLVALPFAAALFAQWGHHRLEVVRRLSDARVPPGQRVTVELEVVNRSAVSTSFLLLEDRLPASLGGPARLVLTGVPGRGTQRVSYTVVPRARGRYVLGPLRVDISDPFVLARLRMEIDLRDELTVTPEVERLAGQPGHPTGMGTGLSRARHLSRAGEDFYTMRPYQEGDDLRRIHWPSVARTGQLMIRQDQSSRRSSALILLDTRSAALGETRRPAFERAVSAAASLGVHLARSGFSLRLATVQSPPMPLSEEGLLELLAVVSHSTSRGLGQTLAHVQGEASADTTLVAVTAPPPPMELAALTRAGIAFGPRLAVLVYPVDPKTLPSERRATLEERATRARLSLTRAGWEVLLLSPSARLADAWLSIRPRLPAASGWRP